MNSLEGSLEDHLRYTRQKTVAYNFLSEFERYAKRYSPRGKHDHEIHNFTVFLWQNLFHRTVEDGPVQGHRVYRYSAYDMPDTRRRGFWRRQDNNVASLFRHYLSTRRPSRLQDDQEKSLMFALGSIAREIPTLKQLRSGKLDTRDSVPVAILPVRNRRTESKTGRDMGDVLIKPYEYKSSYIMSGAFSFLLGGVSRIAIMAALGATGAPVIAGAVVAGVGAGALTSYYKNRAHIREMVSQETTFAGRMKARMRGFQKSYSWKQFGMNTVAALLGAGVGGAAFEAVAENVPMPKLLQDFTAAAKSQLDGALDWGQENAAALASTLGVSTETAMASASSLTRTIQDFLTPRDVINPPAMDVADIRTGTPVSIPAEAMIEPDAVQTEPVTAQEGPAIIQAEPAPPPPFTPDPDARVAQAFGDIAPPASEAQAMMPEMATSFTHATQSLDIMPPLAADDAAMQMDSANVPPAVEAVEEPVSEQAAPIPEHPPEQEAMAASASEPEEAAVPVSPPTYTVERGDSLWKLTREYYGYASADGEGRWDAIAKIVQANPHLAGDPTALQVGETLIMPDLSDPDLPAADCRIVGGTVRGGCTLNIG